MKNFTDEQLNTATKTAPKVIQDEMADGIHTAEVIYDLGQTLHLKRIDVEMIARLNRNMLLALIPPEEFLQELLAAGIPEATAKQIMGEISQKIFMPLRAKMQGGGVGAPPTAVAPAAQPARPATMPAPQARVVMPPPNYAPPKPPDPFVRTAPTAQMPAAQPAPVAQPARPAPQPAKDQWASQWAAPSTVIQANPALPQRPAQIADSMMHYTPFPKPSTPRAVPLRPADPFHANRAERVTAAPPQKPAMSANRMLEDHEEPSPEMRTPQAPLPSAFKPPVPAQRTYTPPTNLPGAMPPPAMPRSAPQAPRPVQQFQVPKLATTSFPPRTPSPSPQPAPRPQGIDHYSMDPYREPLEEKTDE